MPQISFLATMENFTLVNDFLGENLGVEYAGMQSYVELAVEEMLVNIINYAYPQDKPGQVEVGCRWGRLDGERYFCVWFRDWGKAFDPFKEAPEPNTLELLEERTPGGLGVLLVKHVSSHQSYSDTDGANSIELYFSVSTQN